MSAEQFYEVLALVPQSTAGRIDAIVAMWGRVLDAENIEYDHLCDATVYDQNDDGLVM